MILRMARYATPWPRLHLHGEAQIDGAPRRRLSEREDIFRGES